MAVGPLLLVPFILIIVGVFAVGWMLNRKGRN